MGKVVTRAVSEFNFVMQYAPSLDGRFGDGIMRAASSHEYEYLLLQRAGDMQVVAAAKLWVLPRATYLAYIETAKDAKGQRYGRRLFCRLFAHAAGKGAEHSLVLSQYTRFGRDYLMPLETRIARRYAPGLSLVHEYW